MYSLVLDTCKESVMGKKKATVVVLVVIIMLSLRFPFNGDAFGEMGESLQLMISRILFPSFHLFHWSPWIQAELLEIYMTYMHG